MCRVSYRFLFQSVDYIVDLQIAKAGYIIRTKIGSVANQSVRRSLRKLISQPAKSASQQVRRLNEGVVSKETVVLRRWGSSIQKFGFINGVDNVNWPPYRDSKS